MAGSDLHGNAALLEDVSCRACQSHSLIIDWAQGDRVCTACGVVNSEMLMDISPEWRDYGDNNNDGSGKGGNARSGLVAVDETKYVGGLQPTCISKHVFGRTSTDVANLDVRQKLVKANHRMDKMMERQHKKALQRATDNVKFLRRKRHQQQKAAAAKTEATETDGDTINTDTVATGTATFPDVQPDYGSSVIWMEEGPELEQQLLEEEEAVSARQEALYSNKWSLSRAKRVGGGLLNEDLDGILTKAAHDLYAAYEILIAAATTLDLPSSITQEAAAMLEKYAARRDGLKVKGVSSAIGSRYKMSSPSSSKHSVGRRNSLMSSKSVVSKELEVARLEQQRAINKNRQMGALCAALLFWTSRMRNQPRALLTVCNSIQPEKIQRKHCSRAMTELKEYFPELARVSVVSRKQDFDVTCPVPHAIDIKEESLVTKLSGSAESLSNSVEYLLRKVEMPPAAMASVRFLASHVLHYSDPCRPINKSSMTAATAYFVCCAGSTMQQLAAQAMRDDVEQSKNNSSNSESELPIASKRQKLKHLDWVGKKVHVPENDNSGDIQDGLTPLTDAAITEQRAYEMRRMWDAWSEQPSWSRSLVEIEQLTGVSKMLIGDYYKQYFYTDRIKLLNKLRDTAMNVVDERNLDLAREGAILYSTALVPVLLSHISVAGPLMKE